MNGDDGVGSLMKGRRAVLSGLGAGGVVAGWWVFGRNGSGRAHSPGTLTPVGSFGLNGFQGQAVAVSPNGAHIAVLGAFGGDLMIYDAGGTALRRFPRTGTTAELSLDFSGNDTVVMPGTTSLTVTDAMLQLVPVKADAPARMIVGPAPGKVGSNWAHNFSVSADGRLAACVIDEYNSNHVTMADLKTGRTWTIDLRPALGKFDREISVALSPDAKDLAIGTAGHRILFVDPTNGHLRSEIKVYKGDPLVSISALAFSPDGRRVAAGIPLSPNGMTAADNFAGLTIWSVADQKLIRAVETHAQSFAQVTWSSDSRFVVGIIEPNTGKTELLVVDSDGVLPDQKRVHADLASVRFAARAPVMAVLTPDRVRLMTL